jgi:hypothetical protein
VVIGSNPGKDLWQVLELSIIICVDAKRVISMNANGEYRYLKPKRGSHYKQLFVNGRIMAEVLYRQTIGREPLTPQEVAAEYGLPVDAVLEAVDYCEKNQAILDEDRQREAAQIKADGHDRWPYAPRDFQPNA